MCGILLRFCSHAFAFSTDIEKAFLHVKLHPDDRNFTRFLWPPSLEDPTDKFITYNFTVVPFGLSSSPFILAAVLDLHLSEVASPVAVDMKENIYFDNILSGCNTEDELLTYLQTVLRIYEPSQLQPPIMVIQQLPSPNNYSKGQHK